jgi:hypothetical protein
MCSEIFSRQNSVIDKYIYIYIYITAIGLTPGGSSTAHIYTQYTEKGTYITINKLNIHNNKNFKKCDAHIDIKIRVELKLTKFIFDT